MGRSVMLLLIDNVYKKFLFKILIFKSAIKFFRLNSKVEKLYELYLDILKYYLNHQVKC